MQEKLIYIRPTIPFALIVKLPKLLLIVMSGIAFLIYLPNIEQAININDKIVFHIQLSILLLLIFSMFQYLYKVILILNKEYTITSEKIQHSEGVFTKKKNTLQLYRIKDIDETRPLLYRLINTMKVTIISTDKTHPVLHLNGIPKTNITEILDHYIEKARVKKGVREFD